MRERTGDMGRRRRQPRASLTATCDLCPDIQQLPGSYRDAATDFHRPRHGWQQAATPSLLSEFPRTQGLPFDTPTDDGAPFQSDLDGQPEVYSPVDTRLADLGRCLRKAIEGAHDV